MTNPVRPFVQALMDCLSTGRFDLDDEKACQAQIGQWLTDHLSADLRTELMAEHRLSSRDIPDFFILGIVIEVKMNRSREADVLRQLSRYADHPEVLELILLTNRAVRAPATINGKPLRVISLGRAWL
ncbi:MAG: hypothetical protein EPO54_06225 [Brevundimonas sp.]|nr:MAG: hypothetical protein EPO54_06225 [Brevundimonas sp.]